jgi:glycosyltransferase involved in cell wall biosynthesis
LSQQESLRITIVTPTYNSTRTVRDTIESVLTQDYPNLEHIVMDGGSTDGTLDILAEYPHLTWYSENDEGHYHAMQKGAELATGDVLAILNSDDCYRPGTLDKVATAFDSHPEWDALFGDIRFVDSDGKEIYRREEAKYDYDVMRFGVTSLVTDQTLFYRRDIFHQLGGLRYKKFRNCCDYDIILRLGQNGCQVGHVRRMLTDYRIHDFGQTADKRIVENMRREVRLIQDEHGVPRGFRYYILTISYKAKRQLQKLFIRGKVDLVSGRWKLRKHMRDQTTFSSNVGLDEL